MPKYEKTKQKLVNSYRYKTKKTKKPTFMILFFFFQVR